MKKFLILLLFICSIASADIRGGSPAELFQEKDGSPSIRSRTVIVCNDALSQDPDVSDRIELLIPSTASADDTYVNVTGDTMTGPLDAPAISGTTLTDGVASITGGSISNAINGTFSGTVQAEQLTSTDDISMTGQLNCNDYISGLYNPSLLGLVMAGNIWNAFFLLDDVYGGAMNTALRFNSTTSCLELNNVTYGTVLSSNVTTGDLACTGNLDVNGTTATFGDGGNDVTFNFDGGVDGQLRWMTDEDYFQFNDNVLINGDGIIYIRDTAIYIYSGMDGYLNLTADGGITLDVDTSCSGALQVIDTIGVGVTPNDSYLLYMQKNNVTTTASLYGLYAEVLKTGGDTDENDPIYGGFFYGGMADADETIGELVGFSAKAVMTQGTIGTGGASRYAIGSDVLMDINTGTVNGSVYGSRVDVDLESGITDITVNVYGQYITVDDDQGASGTTYMLFLQELSGIDYGIYQNGVAPNFFGGDIRISSDTTGLILGADQDVKLYANDAKVRIDANSVTGCLRLESTDAANDYADMYVDADSILWLVPNSAAVGGVAVNGKFTQTSTNATLAGPTDNFNVGGANIILIDTGDNNVTIGGFINGYDGQVIHLVVIDPTNNATLEHAEGTGNQDIYLKGSADSTLTASYGGWTLVCDGSNWYQCG